MSLEQGVRYNIIAAEKAQLRRTNYEKGGAGLVGATTTDVEGSILSRQIDYILEAKDSDNNFVPNVFLSSKTLLNSETLENLSATQDFLKAGHDGISFFGADQTAFSNIKHNETFSGIENDTMYFLSSNCTVKYNGTEYKYGDFFSVAADGVDDYDKPAIALTKTGAPRFVEVLKDGDNLENEESYYVYGTETAISEGRSVVVGSSTFYPGDVFKNTGTSSMQVSDSSSNKICLIKINGDTNAANNLSQWFSDDYSSTTIQAHETDEKTYLIYDNISSIYNSSLIKPNLLLNNVFKTTLDSFHDQPNKISWINNSRKKPVIREIVKSQNIQPGDEYYLFHDEFTEYGRPNSITYNDIQYTTEAKPQNDTGKQPVFRGINSKNSYSTGSKNINRTNAHQDPDWESLSGGREYVNTENIDLQAGNPMVIKKEPIGLKAGQKYVFVAEPVTSIENGKYYVLSKGRGIKYNNATISTGQVFKGGSETGWETILKNPPSIIYSDGTEEVTLVTNKVTVNTFENNGNPITLETTIKNRKVEFTASDHAVVANSSPILYWTKPNEAGKGYIYKSVDTLEENKKYYIAAEGDGFIQYPPEDLTHACIRPDKVSSMETNKSSSLVATKLTKTELDLQKTAYEAITANPYNEGLCSQYGGSWDKDSNFCTFSNTYGDCVKADGGWLSENNVFSKETKRLHNRDFFSAIHGKCETPTGERLWDREFKDSCKDLTTDDGNSFAEEANITLEWTPYTTFKEKKDTLLAYAVTENNHDQSLVHEVEFREPDTTPEKSYLPDDTKTPQVNPRDYTVAPLKQKLYQYQVLRFLQQSTDKSEPTFVVAEDYDILDENNDPITEIKGWLLYERIPVYDSSNPSANLANRTATASLIVDKTTNGASSTNPFNLYYAEPYELELSDNVSEGSQEITFTANLPFDLNVNELLIFEDSNGKLNQFKVTQKATSGSNKATGLMICPETAQANSGAKAKVRGKKIATYCINTKFTNKQRFTGVEGKPIVRFKDRRRITISQERTAGAPTVDVGEDIGNIEESASTNASIHKIEVRENTSDTPSESVSYTVGGKGFVSVGEDTYHGEVFGRIMINHPLKGTNLTEYNNSKFPWYEDKYLTANEEGIIQTIDIFPASTHVPLGTKLYFPNAVFKLTQNLEEGSTSMVGRFFLQAPLRTRSPRRLYHQDECNLVSIAAQIVDFSSGTQLVSTGKKSFLYKTLEEVKYSDATGSDSRYAEASSEKFSIATAGQEYYIKVVPDEIESGLDHIEENLEYTVKGTGETVELASSYDSTNLEAGTGVYAADREQILNIVDELKEDLPVGTVLTFYPADQVRLLSGSEASAAFDFDSYVAVHRDYDGRTAYDPESSEIDGLIKESIPAKTGGVKFTLTEKSEAGTKVIKGKAEEKALDQVWGTNHIKGAKLVPGCVAEVSRAIVYNNKAFRAGETFTGAKNTSESLGNLPNIYTRYSNNFVNSTKNEKVYAYNAFVDYFLEEGIFSGSEFNISLDLTEDLTVESQENYYRNSVQGDVTGSESKFDFNGAQIDSNGNLINEGGKGRRKHFYYLPVSPTLNLSVSSAKIYKLNYKYIDKDNSSTGSVENSYTFSSGVTYKVGGFGDGYIDTSTNTIGETFTASSSKTFYPSSPSVYDKTLTSLEPSKFYILEYPESFSESTIVPLSTLEYNSKKYFSHNYDFNDMHSSIKIKYYSSEYNMRYPMLNSYLFGRSDQQFVENVRNSNENLGRPNFQKIHETEKRINGTQEYNGTVLWENGLQNFNRYFDILDNSFETFSILRREKNYGQWNKLKLTEQNIEGVRTLVNITETDPIRKSYEFSLAFGIYGTKEKSYGAGVKAMPFIRLVDSEILPSNVSDINYRVESSKESYFSAPTGLDIEAVRTLQPRPENRLKANSRYYLTGGGLSSIKYLGYDSTYGTLKPVDEDTSETITNGQVFTGKADYFDKDDNRIYFGNSDRYVTGTEANGEIDYVIQESTDHQDKVIENRLGTFEFWNYVGGTPLVYHVIEQWEVETNKTYYIAGDADVDRVEYDGKVYKPGESFKAKQLDFNQPFSGDQDMFTDMLSTSDYKEAAARGLKPWMDDSYFRPRERGYIPLTPLVYRTISNGGIKENRKYIVKGSGTIKYNNIDYKASNSIAYPDNHFDATSATAYATNVRRKIKQNEKIETGANYYAYGAGKIKYIEQVKYTGSEIAEGDYTSGSGIAVSSIGVDLPIYSVLSFSNGSTFILSESASVGATALKGTLSGKLVTNSVAPVTKDKYNKQVEIANDYTNGSSAITIETVELPFNMPRGEVLYFYSEANAAKGKLTVSENATAGEKEIKGLLENAGLTAGDKANIVYAREHVYKEYTADGEFSASSSFVGLRGYDYFEITEGNPEVYTDQNLTTTIGERYYVFGTSEINSTSPSNVFYGKGSQTSFTVESGSPEVVEILGEENLEAGDYTVYGNNDGGSEHWLFTHEGENKKHGDTIEDWSAGEVVEKYKSLTGVQSPAEPIVYTKTLDIVSGGQTYKLQALSSSEPRGVVKYVEKSGTCKNPEGATVSSISIAQDCLLEDTVRANLSRKTKESNTAYGGYNVTVNAKTGVQGYTAGNYPLGRDFEIFINDFTKYEKDKDGNSTGSVVESVAPFVVDGTTYSNHKIKKYRIIKSGSTIMFFNGGVLIPSEDVWVEGRYIKPAADPIDPNRSELYEYDLDTCQTYGGSWEDDDGEKVCVINNAQVNGQEEDYDANNKQYVRLAKEKWIAVTIKGQIQEPIAINHNDEAPLFSWEEDAKTAYFTTDGLKYPSTGTPLTTKKSKNGEIENGVTYTLAGGTEIRYGTETIKRGFTFDGSSSAGSEWLHTRNSDGTEYLTSEGSETEFTGIPNYEELEVIEGNPQIFTKSESFIVPEGDTDETYVIEGNDEIKILSNDKISDLSNIKYSNQGSGGDEVDLFAKTGTVESISPRGVIPPTHVTNGYHSGKFNGVSGKTTYQLRSDNWDSDIWVYHDGEGIRSAKLRTDGQWKTTIDNISEETFMWNGDDPVEGNENSTFPNTGITEAEDYIDILVDDEWEWAKTNQSVLVFEGFRLAYSAKKKPSFPDIIPYALEDRSQNQSYPFDIKSSRLLNLFAGRAIVGKDAVLFGRGEIALYDYNESADLDEKDPALRSTTYIKAHSNLKTTGTPEEGEVAPDSYLKKNYRYVVTAGEGKIKKSAIEIFNTNGYHNQKPDGEFCKFGYDHLDFFNNEVISGIRFKTLGSTNIYKTYPDNENNENVTSAIFDSTIAFKGSYEIGDYSQEKDGLDDFITVSVPLPVNLEAGEIIKTSSATLTLSERGVKGDTTIKGVVTVGTLSGSATRRIKLTIKRVFGSKTSEERIDGESFFRALDPTDSNAEMSCPASLTDNQISTSLSGEVNFSDQIDAPVGTRFTAIMDSSFPSGITGVSYSNIIPKTFFDSSLDSSDYIKSPRVEYTEGDPKFLFILGGFADDDGDLLGSDYYNLHSETDNDILSAAAPLNSDGSVVFRHHLYDLNYGVSGAATVSIDEGTSKTAKNNFFIHDGSVNTITPIETTKIKNASGEALPSKIYVYKEVLSGDIESGKTYLVYGTGSITYSQSGLIKDELKITADNEFIPFLNDSGEEKILAFNCFEGGTASSFRTEEYQETFWNKWDNEVTNGLYSIEDAGGTGAIPLKHKARRVSVPRVFELVYFSHYEDGVPLSNSTTITLPNSAADNKGDIYYVYGEGGLTYRSKTIYATNKYVAVGGQNYEDTTAAPATVDNRIKPSSFVYAGRIKQTAGFEHEYTKDGVINPVHKNSFFAENKYTLGNVEVNYHSASNLEPTNVNRENDIVVHRKVHALEGIEHNSENPKKYKVISSVKGEGKNGTNIDGVNYDEDTPLNSITYDSQTVSPQGEQTTLASASGGRTENTGEVTISATSPSDNIGTKTLSKSPKFIVSRRKLSKMKRKGLFRAIRADKCFGCVVDSSAWYIGESSSMVRSKSEFYSDRYGSSHAFVENGEAIETDSTDPNPYQVGKPRGFTYVVRGGGSIKYPVTSSGTDYMVDGESLTRIIPAGESFTPIENHKYFIGSPLAYYLKTTGNETVYRIVDPEQVPDYWKGLDRFAGMAPDRHGTPDGEIKAGISYRVLKYEAPKRLSKIGNDVPELEGLFNIRGEEADRDKPTGSVGYYRKLEDGSITEDTFIVGRTFVGVSGKKSLRNASLGVFVREESGTYGNAPEENWSNQWSMFMTQTVSSWSKTSLWHHDVYGDVLGFLNNRCHLHSLDFNSNKYSHLLYTFAYGIKPVIRSEAPPGYTYLEGSNAQQDWYAVQWLAPFIYDYSSGKSKEVGEAEFQDHLNMLFYRSCQIYRPDYPIDTVKCIDLGQYISNDIKLSNDDNPMASGICIKGSGNHSAAKDEDACADVGGTWIPLKDRVEIKLNRRLNFVPNTRKVRKNLSSYSTSYLKRLHKSLGPGPWAPEGYRTDENAVLEYLIKQRKWKVKQLSTKEEPYYSAHQCHKSRIGDAAPDTHVWYEPDDPWGACDSRFYFTKLVPYAYDNNTETETTSKTPIEIKTFQQMEFYLRAMCGGFIDQESNPKPLEYGGIEPGLLPSSVPVCVMSKDYEYLFENLAYQSLNETGYDEENYKTVELWHDSSELLIKRERRARIERKIELGALTGFNYYHIYRGVDNNIPNQYLDKNLPQNHIYPIASFVPSPNEKVFTDSYYVTLRDEFSKNKRHRIPSVQKYQIVTRDVTHTIVGSVDTRSIGPSKTAIVEDFQDVAYIEWPVGNGKYYNLERKISEMPHYSEWASAPSAKDIEASRTFNETNNYTQNWDVSLSPSDFEKVQFRIKVFFKETIFDNDRKQRIIEAVTDDPNLSSPITVHPEPLGDEDSRMISQTGSLFGDGYLSVAKETFENGTRIYKIKIIHKPSLWLGNSRATTLQGAERLFYRIEYRTLSSYPDGEGQEGDWETVARFDNPTGSRISYIDDTDYSFKNVSYRVSYVKDRLGGVRWISPLFREDRFGKPNDPKGYGPLQNVKLRAAIFNQFANAINLLKEVRVDLPITVRTKDIVKEWVTPSTSLGEPRSYSGNPSPPTWGIYAKTEYAPGPHQTFHSMSDLYHEELGVGSNYGEYFIGTFEGDEWVENGWFSVCASKGFGYATRPWIQGGEAWTALLFTDWQVLVRVPNDQTAMRWAIPSVFLDMFHGKYVTISGLNEHHKVATRYEEIDVGYFQLKYEQGLPALAEKVVMCRNHDETGFSKFGEGVYEPRVNGESVFYGQIDSDAYRSWCGYVPGMAMLVAPPLDVSDNSLFLTPWGVSAGAASSLVCSVGGAASSHCFTSRASTGDNNMTLTVPVLDIIKSKPFNNEKALTGRVYISFLSWYAKPIQ